MFAKTKKSSFVRASIRGQQSVCFIFEMFVVPVTSRDPTAFPASGQTRLSDAGFACTRGRAPRPQHEGTMRGEKHFTRGVLCRGTRDCGPGNTGTCEATTRVQKASAQTCAQPLSNTHPVGHDAFIMFVCSSSVVCFFSAGTRDTS